MSVKPPKAGDKTNRKKTGRATPSPPSGSKRSKKSRSNHPEKSSGYGKFLIAAMIFIIITLAASIIIFDQRAMNRGHIGLWETITGIVPATTSEEVAKACMDTLEEFGVTRQNLRREGWTTISARDNERLRHYVFLVEKLETFQLLTTQFEDKSRKNGITVHNRHVIKKPREWILSYYIGYHGTRTHKLDLNYFPVAELKETFVTDPSPTEPQPTKVQITTPSPKMKAQIALIFDDFGPNQEIARRFLKELDVPITLAILPYQSHSIAIIEQTLQAGQTPFLHIPMEPHNPNSMGELSDRYLKTTMSDDILRSRFRTMLDEHSGIKGTNNHTGSKMTEDGRSMKIILAELKQRGLIFIDSRTTAETVAETLAQELGVPTAARNVFIDQGYNGGDVKANMLKLAEIAHKEGSAIGIGHAIPSTLDDVISILPQILADNIDIVPIHKLTR